MRAVPLSSSTDTLDAPRTISEPLEQQGELYCPNCAYDLRALEGEVCPECGVRVDRAALAQSQIPWVYRARVGRVRAYARTVWIATFQSRLLLHELSRSVDYAQAQRFRWVTVALASIPPAVLLLALILYATGPAVLGALPQPAIFAPVGATAAPGLWDALLPWAAGALLPPVIPLGVVLLFVLVSGVQSYSFQPGSIPVVRQNRAVALSYYAVAPIVWMPLPLILLGGAFAIGFLSEVAWNRSLNNDEHRIVTAIFVIGLSGFVAVVIITWFNLVRLLRHATNDDRIRTVVAAVCFPLEWMGCAALALFAVPWVVGFVYLVFESLWM